MQYALATSEVLDFLCTLPSDSFDGLLCDPPYGLKFMGKKWDYDVPSVDIWRECLRVLKPGAPLLSFGGTRTYHRISCGLEDAGFELRDSLCWLYGKGFPKSLNVSKALDKAAGAERRVIGERVLTGNAAVSTQDKGGTYGVQVGTGRKTIDVTEAATDIARQWDGYGTALKPGWEPITLARRPLDGTVAEGVETWGVGAINIDGCRLARDPGDVSGYTQAVPKAGPNLAMSGANTERSPKPDAPARWPANVVLSHTEECKEVGVRESTFQRNRFTEGAHPFGGAAGEMYTSEPVTVEESVWQCSPDCPVRLLDESTGPRPGTLAGRADPRKRHENPGDNGGKSSFGGGNSAVYADTGGPSRFFYSAKVSTKEREFGCESLPVCSAGEMTEREEGTDGLNSPRAGAGRTGGARNHHPTLKPLALNRWLATLVKPPTPDAVLLVPFSGAGSEMIGALQAGWPAVLGIERDPAYVAIARARLRRWVPLAIEV